MLLCIACLGMMVGMYAEEPKALAVLNFEVQGEAPKDCGQTMSEAIVCLLKDNSDYRLVERAQVSKILKERILKADDVLSEEDRKALMKIGVDNIMLGFVSKIEGQYYGGYRVVDVKTAQVQNEKKYLPGAKNYEDFQARLLRSLQQGWNGIGVDILEATNEIVCQLGPKIVDLASSRRFKIGVFAFGDQKGNATSAMGNLPVVIQNEIIQSLSKYLGQKAKGKFAVLEQAQLQECFLDESADPVGLSPDKVKTTQAILKKAKLDIAILGKYDIQSVDLKEGKQESITIQTSVFVTKTAQKWDTSAKVAARDIENQSGVAKEKISHRFDVQFFVKKDDKQPDNDPTAWQKLPLYTFKNASEEFTNASLLVVPTEMEGKRYKICVVNQGEPALEEHPLDIDRLFAFSLLVDGVDSFCHKKENGTFAPTVVHYSKARKWILTPPGKKLIPDKEGMLRNSLPTDSEFQLLNHTKIENSKLVAVGPSEKPENKIEIMGFQKGREKADSFLFGTGEQSVASEIGITNNLGLITVYVYAEKLPKIERKPKNLGRGVSTCTSMGTVKGEEIVSMTKPTRFPLSKEPCEIIRIFYRYEGNLPCEREDLEAVQ